MRNIIEKINSEKCKDIAQDIFQSIAGLKKINSKYSRLKRESETAFTKIENQIDCRAIYSFFDEIELRGRDIHVEDVKLSCPAFEQLSLQHIKGIFVYVITAGQFELREQSLMQQVLTDLWGTAYVDAARIEFSETIRKKVAENTKPGMYVSEAFGPGFYGMETSQLSEIFKLVNGNDIGVEARENRVLVPVKSCAGIYVVSDKPFDSIPNGCQTCEGNMLSCSLCNVKKEIKSNQFKCTGICSECGKCKNAGMIRGENNRKTTLLNLPDDFHAETGEKGYAIAFDIGTTTVVGMLIDLYTGMEIGAHAVTNSQNRHGMDVISRITFAGKEDGNLELLQSEIVENINEIIDELCKSYHVSPKDIVRGTVCGNTTMSHIFGGYNPACLAQIPFTPAYNGTVLTKAKTLGVRILSEGEITIFPNIAGHVGGDITAGILATRLLQKDALTLFIDIGTNGELVLTDGKRWLTCSTAAGPAFEGASIHQGMRAAVGAIEKVHIDNQKVLFSTIEDGEPVGICGSGLIDAVAEMIRVGVIKRNGRINSAADLLEETANSDLSARVQEDSDGREFIIVYKESGENISITQKDIREMQLAKAAISAGITILLQKLGYTENQIDKVIVAGAFGNFISKESAVAIGLLPRISMDRIVFAGNTAGAGSFMAAASTKEAENAKAIPNLIEHVELAEEKSFQDEFLRAMSF